MQFSKLLLACAMLGGAVLACQVPGPLKYSASPPEPPAQDHMLYAASDVPISRAPFEQVSINWKHRLDQAYVYVEHVGDYRQIGASIARLLEASDGQGLVPTGPLFVLYYDDPGLVPVPALRARACLPVTPETTPRGILRYDVLPSTTVIYALAAGPYGELPRCYPALYQFLRERAWVESGPIRELYLNPEAALTGGELLTEVQIPWTSVR